MSKYTRGRESHHEDDSGNVSYADSSSLSASQYTYGNHREDDVDISMEFSPTMMHPHGGQTLAYPYGPTAAEDGLGGGGGGGSPRGSPRGGYGSPPTRSKTILQFVCLIISTAMIFLMVFFIATGVMDRVFQNSTPILEDLNDAREMTEVPSPSTATLVLPAPTVRPTVVPTRQVSNAPSGKVSMLPSRVTSSSPSGRVTTPPTSMPSRTRSARPSPWWKSMPPTTISSSTPSRRSSTAPSTISSSPPSSRITLSPTLSSPPLPLPTRTVFTIAGGFFTPAALLTELSDQPPNADMVLHLGNFVRPNQCQPSTYADVRSIFSSSNLSIPLFLIPGVNDLQPACLPIDSQTQTPPQTPLQAWNDEFHNLHTVWNNDPFALITQGSKAVPHLSPLISIYHHAILFLGVNLLRDPLWTEDDYQQHLDGVLRWMEGQTRHPILSHQGIHAWVIFGNVPFETSLQPFFQSLVNLIEQLGDAPAVYLWEGERVDSAFPVGNDLLFVSVERGDAPFLTVAVNTEDDAEFAFQFMIQ